MIKITNYKGFIREILKATIKLILAGLFIGFLKSYDAIVAIILLLKIFQVFYKNITKTINKNWILLLGMVITGFAGMVGENWGVSNQYWEYHNVSNKLPLWLPFAWMLAFYFLYSTELNLISFLKNKTITNKVIIAFWLSLIMPAMGEVITINLGVWTYYWPYQIFGVPLYAIICLVLIHMLIYTILTFFCKKWKISDAVFT